MRAESPRKTGWPPPALAQDDCRALSKWFASKPDARMHVRDAATDHSAECIHMQQRCSGGSCKQGSRQCETPEACQVAAGPDAPVPRVTWFFFVVGVAVFCAWIVAGALQ